MCAVNRKLARMRLSVQRSAARRRTAAETILPAGDTGEPAAAPPRCHRTIHAHACTIGLGVGARAIYERFPTASDTQLYPLDLAATATAVDTDRDGVMDAVTDGMWTGRLDETSIGAAVCEGTEERHIAVPREARTSR